MHDASAAVFGIIDYLRVDTTAAVRIAGRPYAVADGSEALLRRRGRSIQRGLVLSGNDAFSWFGGVCQRSYRRRPSTMLPRVGRGGQAAKGGGSG